MNLTEENKRNIMNGFIRIFTRIVDKEYQKRVWIQGEGPECDDFDDTACDFLGEERSILENYKAFGISDDQYHLLKKFRDAFKVFCDENDYPEEFIDTPEWKKIMEMAKEVLVAFNYKKDPKTFLA